MVAEYRNWIKSHRSGEKRCRKPKHFPIALRVYPESPGTSEDALRSASASLRPRKWRRPGSMLVFDTETLVDATQRLTFGSYRFIEDGECLEEGLFCGADLLESDRNILDRYAAMHRADAINKKMQFLTLQEFIRTFYFAAYKGRCLVVGFNLPFDLSRIARGFSEARGPIRPADFL